MKTRTQKQEEVETLKKEFGSTDNALLVGFQGLTVEVDGQLRRQLRDAQLNYRVVKNTLGRLAVEGTPLEPLKEHFAGMTAIAYTENDVVNLAKVLTKFAKENAKFTFKAGVVEGRVINVKDIDALASMPSKEELISKMMFLINSGAQRMAVAISGVARNLAVVTSEVAKQKEAQG
ncbi:MAG TPA: 50S ribosomal protein L10 [Blastocatellia bacterium]|nr:50S ribosomal protein L10 [Blastocatellia bacterium]